MSLPFEMDRRREVPVLGTISLVCFGVWIVLTVLLGLDAVISALHTGHAIAGAVPPHGPGRVGSINLPSTLAVALLVLWIFSLNAILLALVLGVVDIALRFHSVWRCFAYAIVVLAAPVVALVGMMAANDPMLPGITDRDLLLRGLALVGTGAAAAALSLTLIAPWSPGLPPRATVAWAG
jgi:hypothetical protein